MMRSLWNMEWDNKGLECPIRWSFNHH